MIIYICKSLKNGVFRRTMFGSQPTVRKRHFLSAVYSTENAHFNKTGSGQTYEKLIKGAVLDNVRMITIKAGVDQKPACSDCTVKVLLVVAFNLTPVLIYMRRRPARFLLLLWNAEMLTLPRPAQWKTNCRLFFRVKHTGDQPTAWRLLEWM
jgi:hypothetical protein